MKATAILGRVLVAMTASFLAISGCGGGHHSAGGPLVAPTELKAIILAGPAVHLTWKDTPSEHHYSIERKDEAGAFKEIDTNDPNETSYHDANVVTGSYSYRIASGGSAGDKSPYSEAVTIAVP